MKTRNLLIAALLLGGMTAFNSCSEKEIDNIAPSVDQPVAEELETVLTLNTAPGDKVETRAWSDELGPMDDLKEGEEPPLQSKERIRNYVWAIFECDANGNFSSSSLVKAVVGQQVSSDLKEGKDKMYNLAPAKFKMTEGRKLAIVVLANCDALFKDAQLSAKDENGNLLSDIKNYGDFETYCNTFTMGYILNNAFGGYPMSSNVLLLEGVQAGAYNAAGFTSEDDAKKVYASNMDVSGIAVNLEVSNMKPIPLYRMWSQVELTKIAVKKYNTTDQNAEFKLKEVFLMNVPNLSKALNGKEAYSISNSNWFKWGQSLCFDNIDSYIDYEIKVNENSKRQGFASGWSADEQGIDMTLTKARVEKVANNTQYVEYLNRSLANTDGYIVKDNPAWFSGNVITLNTSENEGAVEFENKLVAQSPYNADQQNQPINYFNFVVTESNYGLSSGGAGIMGQSIILVVKGDYSSTNSMGITTTTPDTYYTVMVNSSADALNNQTNVPAHTNEVIRNVKYEIDLTVAGPGSPTPDPTPTTYMTPKVTIVPFGKVTQSAERD